MVSVNHILVELLVRQSSRHGRLRGFSSKVLIFFCNSQALFVKKKKLIWRIVIRRRRKKMATGTFTYNALRSKTLKEHIKTLRKIVSHSNSTRAMLLVWERLPLNHFFPYAYVDLVWFARYCGKMYSRHLFSYGGLVSGHLICLFTLYCLWSSSYVKSKISHFWSKQ